MQLPPHTGARGLSAFSGYFVNIAFNQGTAAESDFHRALQVIQQALQVLPQTAKGF
jgi:hypothetical protein